MTLRPPGSTLFPYTTLFRSVLAKALPAFSRNRIKDLILAGAAAINGQTAGEPKLKVKEGDRLVLTDRKSTRLNSSHSSISYAVFCLKKKTNVKETKCQNSSA